MGTLTASGISADHHDLFVETCGAQMFSLSDKNDVIGWLVNGVLQHSTIFHLIHGCHFYRWGKAEYANPLPLL